MQVIAELRIVHFDLKCDNILVEPICAGEHELDPLELPSERPPFNVILADFGEARMFDASELAATSRCAGLAAFVISFFISCMFFYQPRFDMFI